MPKRERIGQGGVRRFIKVKEEMIVAAKYHILRPAGKGGTASVWLAEDVEAGKKVLCKVLEDPASGRREFRLLQQAGTVCGSGVPAALEWLEQDGTGFMIMEYAGGTTLEEIVCRRGRMDAEEAVRTARALCAILEKLHGCSPPLIHRDLKPANVLAGRGGEIILLDFGSARAFKKGAARDTLLLGTPGYAAPEQFGGWEQSDPRTDVYGVCALLHFLLTGTSPLETGLRPLGEFVPALRGTALEKLLLRCLSVSPAMRCRDCAELGGKLAAILRRGVLYRGDGWVYRAAAGLFAAAVVSGGAFLFLQAGRAEVRELHFRTLVRQERYAEAVILAPEREEGYERLLASAAEDGVVTAEEKRMMEDVLYAPASGEKNAPCCLEVFRTKHERACERFMLRTGLELYACHESGRAAALPYLRAAAEGEGLTEKERVLAEHMLFLCGAGPGERAVSEKWSLCRALAADAEQMAGFPELRADGGTPDPETARNLRAAGAVWQGVMEEIIFDAAAFLEDGADESAIREVIEKAEDYIEQIGTMQDSVPGLRLSRLRDTVRKAGEVLSGEARRR